MQITPSLRAGSVPAKAAPPGEDSSPTWHDSVTLQTGAWTLSAGASAGLGYLAGPQVGTVVAGALGAITGVVTAGPGSRWYDKAASALWGATMNSAISLIAGPAVVGGLIVGGLHGSITGYAWAKGPSS